MSTRIGIHKGTAKRVLEALSRARELSNAQVAAKAECSEGYASRVLNFLERTRPQPMATSRVVQDAEDPQTHFKLWKRGPA